MSRKEPDVPQTMWECRWSRPAHDLGVPDPESLWRCVRPHHTPRAITETDCETCSHWQATAPATLHRERKHRRLRVERSRRFFIQRID
jgi:hypothetical protein